MSLISVIVPMYNAAQYIGDLRESFDKQVYCHFEVICVNDGSKDDTQHLVEEWSRDAQPYKVLCITQENRGVSAARNRGISEANGDYICFVDADDTIAPEYLLILLENIHKNDVKVCLSRIKKGSNHRSIANSSSILSKTDMLHDFLFSGRRYSICSAMFSTSVFKEGNLKFPEGYRYSEDVFLLWKILASSDSTLVIDAQVYNYRVNPKSVMHKVDLNRKDAIELMKQLENYIQLNAPEFAPIFLRFAVARHHWSIMWQAALYFGSYGEFLLYSQNFEIREELKKMITYPKITESLSSAIFITSPYLYYKVVRAYKRIGLAGGY